MYSTQAFSNGDLYHKDLEKKIEINQFKRLLPLIIIEDNKAWDLNFVWSNYMMDERKKRSSKNDTINILDGKAGFDRIFYKILDLF